MMWFRTFIVRFHRESKIIAENIEVKFFFNQFDIFIKCTAKGLQTIIFLRF